MVSRLRSSTPALRRFKICAISGFGGVLEEGRGREHFLHFDWLISLQYIFPVPVLMMKYVCKFHILTVKENFYFFL